jgi:hypothetical protein
MEKGNQSGMIRDQNVEKQLEQLEQQNPTNEENKKGSTNEIQPMATEDGLTQ